MAIQAMHHDLMREYPIDITINIASMQEMDPPAIAAYFDDLSAQSLPGGHYFFIAATERKKRFRTGQ